MPLPTLNIDEAVLKKISESQFPVSADLKILKAQIDAFNKAEAAHSQAALSTARSNIQKLVVKIDERAMTASQAFPSTNTEAHHIISSVLAMTTYMKSALSGGPTAQHMPFNIP